MAANDFDAPGQPFSIYDLEQLALQEAFEREAKELEREANEDEYLYSDYDYALARAKVDYRAFLDEARQKGIRVEGYSAINPAEGRLDELELGKKNHLRNEMLRRLEKLRKAIEGLDLESYPSPSSVTVTTPVPLAGFGAPFLSGLVEEKLVDLRGDPTANHDNLRQLTKAIEEVQKDLKGAPGPQKKIWRIQAVGHFLKHCMAAELETDFRYNSSSSNFAKGDKPSDTARYSEFVGHSLQQLVTFINEVAPEERITPKQASELIAKEFNLKRTPD